MNNILKLIRVKHWIKNFLVFFPLVFSGLLFNLDYFLDVIAVFIMFSLVASSVYIINDIKDLEKDRLHEKKKHRPIATGAVSINTAYILIILLLLLTISSLVLIQFQGMIIVILVSYLLMNVLYSIYFKQIPLIELLVIVMGFLFRILIGGIVIDVEISSWLFLTVLSMSFFLAVGKRRNELIRLGDQTRGVLLHYPQAFLDKFLYLFLALTLVFYSLWTVFLEFDVNNNLLIWTVPLVILITMRYSMILEGESLGDPTEMLFKDKWLFGAVLSYGFIMIMIFYS
jgi:decaprenyl-phosphate phosphoribosyltransferase